MKSISPIPASVFTTSNPGLFQVGQNFLAVDLYNFTDPFRRRLQSDDHLRSRAFQLPIARRTPHAKKETHFLTDWMFVVFRL